MPIINNWRGLTEEARAKDVPTLAHRDLAALSDLRDADLKKTVTSSE
jgi:hypothetical protein